MSILEHIRTEVIRKSNEIPFGNSQFQNEYFVEYASQTPARAYRSLLLKLNARLNDITDFEFKLEELAIDIAEWEYNTTNEDLSIFDQQRAAIKVKRAKSDMDYNRKLAADAIIEIEQLWGALSKYPEFTRDEFEAQELHHFEKKLTRQLEAHPGKEGVIESLLNIKNDKNIMTAFIEASIEPSLLK